MSGLASTTYFVSVRAHADGAGIDAFVGLLRDGMDQDRLAAERALVEREGDVTDLLRKDDALGAGGHDETIPVLDRERRAACGTIRVGLGGAARDASRESETQSDEEERRSREHARPIAHGVPGEITANSRRTRG